VYVLMMLSTYDMSLNECDVLIYTHLHIGQNPVACADEISTGLDAAVTYDISW